MKTSSAKAKGRKLQQWTRDLILRLFDGLEEDDVKSTSMGAQGHDVQLSPAARRVVGPLAVECKSNAKFAGYKFLEQASAYAKPNEVPIAVVKANQKKPIVLVDAEYFFNLLTRKK